MRLLSKNKKSAVTTLKELILLAIVVAVVVMIVLPRFGSFTNQMDREQLKLKLAACLNEGKELEAEGKLTDEVDKDKDKLPNRCDNCPTIPNDMEGTEDKDGDGFPVPKDLKKFQGKICCGNDGTGNDDPELTKDKNKYCETEENDHIYGPGKLLRSYRDMKG